MRDPACIGALKYTTVRSLLRVGDGTRDVLLAEEQVAVGLSPGCVREGVGRGAWYTAPPLKSNANTVKDYLAALPGERRALLGGGPRMGREPMISPCLLPAAPI